MKENEQSRFVRWGIPGWTMFLSFAGFSMIDILLSPASSKNTLIGIFKVITEIVSLNATASAVGALLVAAAGIPLGFVIYQAYFYVRWNSPFSKDGLFPPFIVGRLNDLERTMAGINPKDIVGDDPWRKEWTKNPLYKADHGWKWRYIENFFMEIVQYMDGKLGGVGLYVRYRYLMDLMHTLGAALFGIYVGFFGYVMFKVKTDDISLSIILIVSIISLFLLLIPLDLEDKVKREKIKVGTAEVSNYLVVRPIKRLEFFQLSNPSANYFLFLFMFLYLGSPSPYTIPYTQSHLWFRVTVLSVIIAAWLFSKRRYSWKVFLSELVTLALFASLAFISSQLVKNWATFRPEWWNIGWSILFFLIMNMVFVKNRQNARDDLIAMQNYAIKRYFSNSIQPFELPSKSDAKRKTPQIKRSRKTGRGNK
jgi:hypothetical protein